MSQRLIFVPTDESATIRSAERQLIRRHCMQQKNRKPGSRRSMREAARATAVNLHKSEKHAPNGVSGPQIITTGTREQVVSHSATPTGQWQKQALNRVSNGETAVPPAPPSDWALFQFPENLEVSSQKLMHECFIRNPIRDPLCPFKLFGILVSFDQDPFWCFRLLISEQLCFQAILLLNSASNDLMLRRPLSNTTYRHLRLILPILNNRLTEKNAHKDDLILYVVGILASISILFEDYNAAKTHATGLSEIIRLRGGFGAVKNNPLIKFAIDRLNFSSMLVTKSWTSIYDGSVWEKPSFSAEVLNLHHSQRMVCIDGLVDSKLADVFHTLQYTTILLTKHYYDQTPIDGTALQECLGFVHFNLVELEGRPKNNLSDCIRLGMMAFLATTFRLPELYEQPYCKVLTNKLQLSYATAKDSIPDIHPAMNIWLIFVCLISSGTIDGPGIWASWSSAAMCGMSWDEMKIQLKQVMWIDAFHDDLGKRAFRKIVEPCNLSVMKVADEYSRRY